MKAIDTILIVLVMRTKFLAPLIIVIGTIGTLALTGIVFVKLLFSDITLCVLLLPIIFLPFVLWILYVQKLLKEQKKAGAKNRDLNKSTPLKWFHYVVITLLVLALIAVFGIIMVILSSFV